MSLKWVFIFVFPVKILKLAVCSYHIRQKSIEALVNH